MAEAKNAKLMMRLKPAVYRDLKRLAEEEGRTASNLAAHLVTTGVQEREPARV